MKFSVLIPVYNAEKYLDECLASILGQTYKNFEIILVDDGSTDSSPNICDKYQREYSDVVKVLHQQNSGQLISRCNAINAAQGDYCIFMDSDDLIVSDALQVLNNIIKEYNLPDMVVYPFYYDRNGKLEKSKTISNTTMFFDKGNNSLRELFFTSVLLNSMCVKCVKTSVLKRGINNTKEFSRLRCSEDRLQSMWVLDEVETSVYIDIPLYRYRLFDGSVTRQYSPDNISRFDDSMLYDEQIKYAQKWGLYSQEWKARLEANVVNHMLYVFDLFYTKVEKRLRQKVLAYSWESFLPMSLDADSIRENKFVNDVKKKLFYQILNDDFKNIKRYYIRKELVKTARNIKRKLLH